MIFTTWRDSPAKRCQIIFFTMFDKKVFQLVKPFLANLHSTISKKYSYMYSMTPKFFYFFFNIWVSKKRRILRSFQIRGNNLKKVYQEKVICQKLVQVSSIEEGQTPILHTSFACNLFVSKFFCIFLNRFQISVKFWAVLVPIFKFCEEKFFWSY